MIKNLKKTNINLELVYQYLLISLAFIFPLTVAGGNLIIGVIVIIWLFSGDYSNKFNKIRNNKLAVASIVFFLVHVVGMLWTEDINWGLTILKKMSDFIFLLPILLTITNKKYIKYYISAFILSMTLTELLSYLVWFEVIDSLHKATPGNPTPTMSHISYNPFLTIGIYLILHELLFNKSLSSLYKFGYLFFSVTMSINMFITGGRTGQVMYFMMLVILIFQLFGRSGKLKSFVVSLFLVPTIFFTAYSFSDIFNTRVNAGINNAILFFDDVNKNTSIGQRFTYSINSLEIIKNNLLFGVGTGDFPVEYNKIHSNKTPEVTTTVNPHNMYTLVAVQSGLVGVLSMFFIFYQQIKYSLRSNIKIVRDLGVVLPLLFLVIMFGDSYLLGHFTTILFVFFSSFLYKDFEKT